MLHSSRLFIIYFLVVYISNLTVIISSMFCTSAVETVKSCISLFLLPANLHFQVVSFMKKTHLPLKLHFKLYKNTSKFLEVIDPFVAEIWSFTSWILLALQLSLKHAFTRIFWNLLYFDAQYFILTGENGNQCLILVG